jgi:hypothetical protein
MAGNEFPARTTPDSSNLPYPLKAIDRKKKQPRTSIAAILKGRIGWGGGSAPQPGNGAGRFIVIEGIVGCPNPPERSTKSIRVRVANWNLYSPGTHPGRRPADWSGKISFASENLPPPRFSCAGFAKRVANFRPSRRCFQSSSTIHPSVLQSLNLDQL